MIITKDILIAIEKRAVRKEMKDAGFFDGRFRSKRYKDKKKGRNILVYTKQGISKPQLVKNQKILLSKSELFFDSKINYDSHRTSKNCSYG